MRFHEIWQVVDFPGHLRMRGKANDMLPEARCIVYLVDSDDKPKLKEHQYYTQSAQRIT